MVRAAVAAAAGVSQVCLLPMCGECSLFASTDFPLVLGSLSEQKK